MLRSLAAVVALGVGALLAPTMVVGGFASTSSASAADEAAPQLRRDGRWMVDQHGRVVLVHGVNLVWKHAPYVPPDSPEGFTEADAEWLAEHGFNGARIGTLWAGVTPDAPGVADPAYFDAWQRIIDDLAARGIWMQFDFHQDQWHETYGGEGVPDWAVKRPLPWSLLTPVNAPFPLGYWTPEQSTVWDAFWADRHGLQTGWRAAWRLTAERWRDQPYSMGYDLLNEPWAGLEWADCALTGCPSHYARELQPAMTRTLDAIREVDPDNLVWFEPQQLSAGLGSPTYFSNVGDPQLGFSWHNYCPQVFLESQGIPGQDAAKCASYVAKMHTQAAAQAERMGAVGVMSEFGATDNLTALAADTAGADDALASWFYWAYKTWNDPTTADTAQSLFVDDDDLASVKPKVRTLVRTYPQATCGTPASLDFDPGTGAFRYAYTAGSCGGAPTEVFVSPLHYPGGYDVDVTGGTLAGTASHHRVLVDAAPGTEVVVTVRRSA